MRTTIELTKDVAKKLMDSQLKPFDFEHMPFERFTIQFPYGIFQNPTDMFNQIYKDAKGISKNAHQQLMNILEHTCKQNVDLHIHKKNKELKIKLTFHQDVLFEGRLIVEPMLIPIPRIISCKGHSNPQVFCFMLFGIAVGTLHIFNEPKIIKESTQEKVDKATGKRTYTTNKKKYVYNTRYVFKNAQEHLEKRVYNIHTEVWEQRGHYRTYKSGKRVWVKPCIKTRGKSEIKDNRKQYKITRV